MVGYTIHPKKKKPEWLDSLLRLKFFEPCSDHIDHRKNEMNVFCIDCNRRACQHCLSSSAHSGHQQLQIRRYVYNDVIRVEDMKKHFDCRGIQPYTTNGAKVVFLNARSQSQTKSTRSNSGSSCEACVRSLTDEDSRYCSIACKVSMGTDHQSPPSLSFPIWAPSNQSPHEPNLREEESSNSVAESSLSEMEQPQLNNSSELKPKKRPHKRKGVPRRSHLQ